MPPYFVGDNCLNICDKIGCWLLKKIVGTFVKSHTHSEFVRLDACPSGLNVELFHKYDSNPCKSGGIFMK